MRTPVAMAAVEVKHEGAARTALRGVAAGRHEDGAMDAATDGVVEKPEVAAKPGAGAKPGDGVPHEATHAAGARVEGPGQAEDAAPSRADHCQIRILSGEHE
jgi:hypothetical protein